MVQPNPAPLKTVKPERIKIFRWKAIYIILGLFLIGFVSAYFFKNFIATWTIERSLETIIGASVEAEQVNVDLATLSVTIERLQMANPRNTWQNIIEAKKVFFQVAGEPLLQGKTVIEGIIIDEMMLNTPRRTNGNLNRPLLPGPFGEAQKQLQKDIADLPILNPEKLAGNFDVNQILSGFEFETDLSALDIKQKLEDAGRNWKENLQDFDNAKMQLKDIQLNINEFNAYEPKTLLDYNRKLDMLKQIQKAIGQFQRKIDTTQKAFSGDFRTINNDIDRLRKIADGDYSSLLKKANLPNISNINVGQSLFGRKLLNESSVILNLVTQLRRMMPVELIPIKEEHIRGGQDIRFSSAGPKVYPNFLIKHIDISGRGTSGANLSGYYAHGTLDGLTDEPLVYGKPMVVSLYGKAPNQAYLNLNGALSHINSNYHDRINFKIGNLPLPEFEIAEKSAYIPTKISAGRSELDAQFEMRPDFFRFVMQFRGRNLTGSFEGKPDANNMTAELVRSIMTRIDLLVVDYKLEGRGKQLSYDVSSNLDQIITARIRSFVGAKVELALKPLRDKVEAKLLEHQMALTIARQQYESQIQARISDFQAQLKKPQDEFEARKKEFEAQLKQATSLKQPSISYPPGLTPTPKPTPTPSVSPAASPSPAATAAPPALPAPTVSAST
jgi:uncharacterized protein (TIGR03545 family)